MTEQTPHTDVHTLVAGGGARRAAPQRRRGSFAARFLRKPFGIVSAAYLLLLLVASFAPTLLTSVDPLQNDYAAVLSTPSAAHPLGTDALGRDLLSRLIHGTGAALMGVLVTALVTVAIAVPLGLAAAMSRRVDAVMSGVNDVVLSVPGIVVLLMVIAVSGSLNWAMAAFGLLSAPQLVRVVRSSAMVVVEEPYVAAAKVFGQGTMRIAFRHVLPRIVGPIVVTTSIIASSALGVAAGLNYLGLGIKPPLPSWGGVVADGASVVFQQPWTLVPGGLLIAVTIVVFVLMGDTVRDVLVETWAPPSGAKRRGAARAAARADRAARTGFPPADPEAVLQVDGLTVSIPQEDGGTLDLVQDVSFSIRRGEALGVVGESGCGKTMTGLAVLGALPDGVAVSAGRILIDGSDVLAMPDRDRRRLRGSTIAFVSQEPMVALDPLFTIGFQIGEAVRTHTGLTSRARVSERVRELLTQVRINDPERVQGSYPHEISGGMAQRVAIAIALAGNPKILIADEPTTALDVTVQSEIVALLRSLGHEMGLSVMLISHDWGVVSEICSSAVVMYAGQAVERGAVAEILAAPTHPYTDGLLAANPHYAEPGERLHAIPGSVPPPAEWPESCHFADRCAFATEACRSRPIEMTTPRPGRESRCIRIEALTSERASR